MSASGTAAEAGPTWWPRVELTGGTALAALAVVGLALSGYMAIADLARATLACGGAGGCDVVHASPYARLWGVPISVLGAGAYGCLNALLLVRARRDEDRSYLVLLGVLALALAGTVFSGYLTYLEFFVIRALCSWCLASALILCALTAVAAAEIVGEIRASQPSS